MKSLNKHIRGFTAIELLIAVFILSLIAGGIVFSFKNFQKHQSITFSAARVVGLLEEARALTLSAKNDTNYGVHFEASQAVLFEGASYVAGAEENKPIVLDAGVAFTAIDLNGGGSEVVFERLTGATSQYGTTTLSVTAETTEILDIVIHKTGLIEQR